MSGSRTRLGRLGLALLVLAGAGFGVYSFAVAEDPEVVEARQLSERIFSEEGRRLSQEERAPLMEQFRKQWEKLTPEQRDRLRREMQVRREKRENERLARFFALSPAEQEAELDRVIDEMEARRAEWAARRAAGESFSRRRPGGDSQARDGSKSRETKSPDERRKERILRLDQSTPEERARRSAYRKMLRERRKALGLDSGRRGRG